MDSERKIHNNEEELMKLTKLYAARFPSFESNANRGYCHEHNVLLVPPCADAKSKVFGLLNVNTDAHTYSHTKRTRVTLTRINLHTDKCKNVQIHRT